MDTLTEREKEILCYLIKGLSNKEIGEILFISKHTAKAHVCAILRKFNVKSRAEVAYLVGKNNILSNINNSAE